MTGKSLRVVATGMATLAASLVLVGQASAATLIGAWQTQAPAAEARSGSRAFATPGGIFVVGDSTNSARARSALAYDIATDTWSSAGSPAGEHDGNLGAGQLLDGRIAVVGGWSVAADLFDPVSSTWTALPSMAVERSNAQVLGLADGSLLVAGGDVTSYNAPATAEVFDPLTNTWSSTSAPPFWGHLELAGQLPSGRVLAVGSGSQFGGGSNNAALWDPISGVWSAAASYPVATYRSPKVIVSQGSVVGFGADGGYYGGRDAYRYDEQSNAWTRLGDLQSRRGSDSAAVTLPDGRLLIAGGCCPLQWSGAAGASSAEILDMATGQWTATGRLNAAHYEATLVVSGGSAYAFRGVLERFDPASAPPAFDPRVGGIGSSADPDARSRKSVTAFAYDAASFLPLASTPVRMVVEAGPSLAGTTLSCAGGCTTDADGQVVGSYANTRAAGTDVILIHGDLDNDATVDSGEPTTTVNVTWTQRLTQVTVHHPVGPSVDIEDLEARVPLGLSAYLGWVYLTRCDGGGYGGGGCTYLKAPLAGRTLNFYGRTSKTLLCSGVTGADGIAHCGLPTEKVSALAENGIRVVFAGDSLYAGHTGVIKFFS